MQNEFITPEQVNEQKDASYINASSMGLTGKYDLIEPVPSSDYSQPLTREQASAVEQGGQGFLSWVIKPLTMLGAGGAVTAAFGHDYQSPTLAGQMLEGLNVVGTEFRNRLFYGQEKNYGYRMAERIVGEDASEGLKTSIHIGAEILLDPTTWLTGGGIKFLQSVMRGGRMAKGTGKAAKEGHKLWSNATDKMFDTANMPIKDQAQISMAKKMADANDPKGAYLLLDKVQSPEMSPYLRPEAFNEVEELIGVYKKSFGDFEGADDLIRLDDNGKLVDVNEFDLGGIPGATRFVESVIGFRKADFASPNVPKWYEDASKSTQRGIAEKSLNVRLDKMLGGKPINPKYQNVNAIGMAKLVGFIDEYGGVVSRNQRKYQELGGDDLKLKFVKSALLHVFMLDELAGRASEAGRTLHMLRTDAADTISKVRQIANAAAAIDSDGIIFKQTARYTKNLKGEQHSKFWSFIPGSIRDFAVITEDSMYNWYINSMLYSWKTFSKNLISNTLAVTLLPTERMIAGAIGTVMKGDIDHFRLAWHESRAFLNGMNMGMRDFWRIFRRENITDAATGQVRRLRPEDLGYPGHIVMNSHELAEMTRNRTTAQLQRTGWMGRGMHWLGHNWAIQAPGRALHGTDKLFKMALYRADVARISAAKTVTNNTPLLGAASRYYRHNMDSIDAQMSGSAANTALYGTFSKPFQGPLRAVSMIANLPVIKYYTPFIRTNVNLVGYGMERTPLALLTPAFRRQFGQKGAQRHLAMAKMASGTAIFATLMSTIDSEHLTGFNVAPGSPEWRERKNMGIPDTSIWTGNGWFDYSSVEPLRAILAPVDIYKRLMDYADPNDEVVMKDIGNLAIGYMSTYGIMSSSEGFFSGFSSLLNAVDVVRRTAISDEEGREDVIERIIMKNTSEFASRMVPNILKDVAVFMDPRATISGDLEWLTNAASRVAAKIPGLSEELPSYRNFWGKEITLPRVVNGLVNFNYLYDPSNKMNKYNKEMLRLGVQFTHLDRKAMEIRVTPLEYSEMQRYFGGIVSDVIPKMMRSSVWKSIPDAAKKTEIEAVITKAKHIARLRMAGSPGMMGNQFRLRHQQYLADERKRKFGM